MVVAPAAPHESEAAGPGAEVLRRLDGSVRQLRRSIDTGRYDEAVIAAREIRDVAGPAGLDSLSKEAEDMENWDAERFAKQGVVAAAGFQQFLAGLKQRYSTKTTRS